MAEAAQKTPSQVQKETSKAPARWQERDFLDTLRHEVERVFQDFDRALWGFPTRWHMPHLEPFYKGRLPFSHTPSVDIVEKEAMFELTADLPGVDEKNIEIKLSGDILTMKGQREERKEEKKEDFYPAELKFGSFERSFRVPENIEADKIDAKFSKGVLTVTLPKKPGAQKAGKKISVKSA